MSRWVLISLCLGCVGGLMLCERGTARDQTDVAGKEPSDRSSPRSASQLGSALSGVLKPQRFKPFPGTAAPGAKGLVQQSEWKLPNLRKRIQLALVLDATNSMRNDIDDLKANLRLVIDHLRHQVNEVRNQQEVKVQIAIVVYRDWWREFDFEKRQLLERRDSPVEILTQGSRTSFVDFDSNWSSLLDQLQGIPTEWGHPGPEEQVDLGIATALEKLDWLNTDKVSRLILVAGDMPPWGEENLDWSKNPDYWTYWEKKQATPRPLRQYSTSRLIELAQQRNVSILALACDTKTETVVTDEERQLRGRMREFFQKLADGTNGKFLNLTDTDTVARLQFALQSGGAAIQQLRTIKAQEVAERKQRPSEAHARIAVLPPIATIDYRLSYEDDAYLLAKLLTKQLQDIDPELTSSGDQVQRAWLSVSPGGQVSTDRLSQVAKELRASFLIWGAMQPANGNVELTLKLYDANGQLVVETDPVRGNLLTAPELAWRELLKLSADIDEAANFHKTFQHLAISTNLVQKPDSLRELMRGYSQLEEAASATSDDPEGRRLTEAAALAFQNVLQQEPNSVFAHLMLASCQLNRGQTTEAKQTLAQARELASTLPDDDLLRWEVEADYAWVVNSDSAGAIQAYQRILDATKTRHSRIALRAHWMLTGLLLGTVPQNEPVTDSIKRLDTARDHILEILVNWPDTPEARFYGRYVHPRISPDPEPSVPARIADVERRIAVPLAQPKRLLGGW